MPRSTSAQETISRHGFCTYTNGFDIHTRELLVETQQHNTCKCVLMDRLDRVVQQVNQYCDGLRVVRFTGRVQSTHLAAQLARRKGKQRECQQREMAHPLRHFGGEVPLGVAYVNLTVECKLTCPREWRRDRINRGLTHGDRSWIKCIRYCAALGSLKGNCRTPWPCPGDRAA